MKYEWRKNDKDLYLPKAVPTEITVPPYKCLIIEGEGDPNGEAFGEKVEALYALSYGIKMLPKKGINPDGYFEYTVFPLEGIWDMTEEGKEKYSQGIPLTELKGYLSYNIMIRQPDFVTGDLLEDIRTSILKKKKNDAIVQVKLETIEEGRAVQMLHVGTYDDEPASFEKLEVYCKENGMKRIGKSHKEIYLTDPKKVSPEKLKTTLRIWVE